MNNRKDRLPLISFGETMYRKTEDFVTLTLVFLSFWAIDYILLFLKVLRSATNRKNMEKLKNLKRSEKNQNKLTNAKRC